MNTVVESYVDKNGNQWEVCVKQDFAGNKYKVLCLNGKQCENLGRIW